MAWFRKDKPKAPPESDPANPYAGLRSLALHHHPDKIGSSASTSQPHVFGGLMEIGMANGVATLVALADGTVSLYLSSGSGVSGAGANKRVGAAIQPFLDALNRHLRELSVDVRADLPAAGEVHLRALTLDGRLVGSASEDDLGHRRHPLSDVFYAGQNLLTAIREERLL